RRDHDAVGRPRIVSLRMEVATLLPLGIPARLDGSGLVTIGDRHGITGAAVVTRHRAPSRWNVTVHGAPCPSLAAMPTCSPLAPVGASHTGSASRRAGSRSRTFASGTKVTTVRRSPAASAANNRAAAARSSRCHASYWRCVTRAYVPLLGLRR